jgi:ubiquinone/menaquinone biosynthesis C-methylase UbiE
VTDVVVRQPRLWGLLRGRLRRIFDTIAPTWETRIGPHHVAALELALAELSPPARVLDLGTGTGVAAKTVAQRFPNARVAAVDLSPTMIAEAKSRLPAELDGRVVYEVADAAELPFDDGAFGLVTLANMIPFFDELARVTAPGGTVVFSFSRGAETPIYVSFGRLRRELARRAFAEFADFSAGPATALRATKR